MPTISVKGYSGQELTYENVEKVYFNSPGSTEKVPFSYGDTAENIPVTLDLTGGDQTITAPDGTLVKSAIIAKPEDLAPENVRKGKTIAGVEGNFIGDTEEVTVDLNMADGNQTVEPSAEGKVLSKVNIIKPDTLIPANIAEGVDIAGIIGTLAAGGGAAVAAGTFKPTSAGMYTLEHGLGVTPDLVFIYALSGSSASGTNYITKLLAISAKLKELSGWGYYHGWGNYQNGSSSANFSPQAGIETSETSAQIHDANASNVTIGTSSMKVNTWTYHWLAIGGLT